jgi:hypothetical protein
MDQSTFDDLKLIVSFAGPHPLKKPKTIQDYDRKHVALAERLLDVPIPLDKVEVRESPIHGRGVFAKKKVSKGELITVYPAHYVSVHPEGHSNPGAFGLMGSALAERSGSILTEIMRRSYSFDVTDHYVIYGHPDLIDDPVFLGHMINDGAKGHSTKTNYDQKDSSVYDKVSLALSNAEFELLGGLCVCVVATKEINIGDEVLVTYGYPYWISVNSSQ